MSWGHRATESRAWATARRRSPPHDDLDFASCYSDTFKPENSYLKPIRNIVASNNRWFRLRVRVREGGVFPQAGGAPRGEVDSVWDDGPHQRCLSRPARASSSRQTRSRVVSDGEMAWPRLSAMRPRSPYIVQISSGNSGLSFSMEHSIPLAAQAQAVIIADTLVLFLLPIV